LLPLRQTQACPKVHAQEGGRKGVKELNKALGQELTAFNRYFLRAPQVYGSTSI